MKRKVDENTLFTSANIVTFVRILFVPIFVVALISPWPSWIDNSGSLDFIKPWVALAIFIVLSVTDSIDGYLARSRNEITNFGKFMDPLADKILVFAALISLVELSVLPSWVVLIILMREFIVSGIRMLAAAKGQVIAASWYGKAKTVTQLIAIILFILKESLASSGAQDIANPLYIIAWAVMIIALILTIISMIDYIKNAMYIFKPSNNINSYEIASKIIKTAKERGIKIACAESITGGKISSALTSVSGSSSVFAGAIVSYMYHVKQAILGVDKELLKNKGAINEQTATQMAEGALRSLNCDFAISTTGIAGPNSDEFNNPVGTAFVGFASKDKTCFKEFNLSGSREEIRDNLVVEALSFLYEQI